MRFKDKVCIVTGGGSGIGKATCKQLAAEGGKVAVIDISEEGGNNTVREITATGGRAVFVKADVSISEEVQAAVKFVVQEWDRIDVLVNNAAKMTFRPLVELPEEEWDSVLAVNLRSVFLFCKYSIPHMERGVIVNTSSVHAHQTNPTVAHYAASKGGMEALTRALSRELDPRKIRINCVAPGGVKTPMLWSNPGIVRDENNSAFAEPEDIAAIICFIASDEARVINGTTVLADQGLLQAL
jgi:NAD(P)-dependent dehydrogenase (short-subunit alcohol dehydrogenase family)